MISGTRDTGVVGRKALGQSRVVAEPFAVVGQEHHQRVLGPPEPVEAAQYATDDEVDLTAGREVPVPDGPQALLGQSGRLCLRAFH